VACPGREKFAGPPNLIGIPMQNYGNRSPTMSMKRLTSIAACVLVFLSLTARMADAVEITLTTDKIDDTFIGVKMADGQMALDNEFAEKNFADAGIKRMGERGDKRLRALFRIDVSNLDVLNPKEIDNVRLIIHYNYPTNNKPTLGLYAITDQDAGWKSDEVTWKQMKNGEEWSGGPGGGEPGDGSYAKSPLDTYVADPETGHGGTLVFDIPPSLLGQWVGGKKNPGLMLKVEGEGSIRLYMQEYPPATTTRLKVDAADWNPEDQWARKVSGELAMLGAPGIGKQLMEKTLESALEEFNPNLHKVPADDIKGRWSRFGNAFDFVKRGGYDLTITSREDWNERVPEKDKKGMKYVPVAKQLVFRDREVAGGVEYGVAYPEDVWIPQVQAFLEFIRSSEARERLAEKNHYLFAPADRELPEFEAPDYWRDKPWETEKEPMMVHGVDFHEGGYNTTVFAELTKMKMMGYNSVMYGGHSEKVMEWADENGMLLSGTAQGSLTAAARKMARHPSCWGTFLANEDTVSHWMTKMYRHSPEGHDFKYKNPGRIKDFMRIKYGGFEEWAKEKHENLEKLNNRWNTDYNSWAEIFLPDPRLDEIVEIYDRILGPEEVGYQWRSRLGTRGIRYTMAKYPDLLDLRRHSRRVWASWYDERIAEMRKHLGDDFRYTVKAKPHPHTHRASDQFNGACHDHGPCKYAAVDLQIFVDTVQIAKGWPVWNAEDHIYTHSNARKVRFDIFSKYLMGQFQDTTYLWGGTGGRAISHKRSTDHGRAEKYVRNKIRQYEPIFRAFLEARADAGLTVLATEGNLAWDEYDPRPEESYLGGAVKAYAYMGALGRQWKYVLDADVSAESVQDVMVIDTPWLLDETVEKLNELPSDRRLIAIGEVPTTNEYGEPLPKEGLAKLKKRTTVIEDWSELSKEVPPADGLMEPYTTIGQGKYWIWNRFRGRPPWSFHLPAARLELRRVKHDGKLYVAVMNHADEPVTAPLPWADDREVRLLIEGNLEKKDGSDKYVFGGEAVALFEME